MTVADSHGRISRSEGAARIAVGMPGDHPERVTCKPGRAEWKLVTAWLAEMRPHDEYTAIIAEAWRQGVREDDA